MSHSGRNPINQLFGNRLHPGVFGGRQQPLLAICAGHERLGAAPFHIVPTDGAYGGLFAAQKLTLGKAFTVSGIAQGLVLEVGVVSPNAFRRFSIKDVGQAQLWGVSLRV